MPAGMAPVALEGFHIYHQASLPSGLAIPNDNASRLRGLRTSLFAGLSVPMAALISKERYAEFASPKSNAVT
jgi:hypothetical protein